MSVPPTGFGAASTSLSASWKSPLAMALVSGVSFSPIRAAAAPKLAGWAGGRNRCQSVKKKKKKKKKRNSAEIWLLFSIK